MEGNARLHIYQGAKPMLIDNGSADAASHAEVAGTSFAIHADCMSFLLQTIQALSLARDLPSLYGIVRHAARRLLNSDGATLVLRDGEMCYYIDEDAIEPLWKGKRFPLEHCISGWSMMHRTHVVIDDIYADNRIPHDAYRPTFVKSLLMVPIRMSEPIGAIGNYWAQPHSATPEEVQLLQALADSTSIAFENVQVYQQLEELVRSRTEALHQAMKQIEQLSLTDELTGLYNRRGLKMFAEQAMRRAARSGDDFSVIYIDLDGLKQINDQYGHNVGDEVIVNAARLLLQTFRDSDVIARLGGDEFCIFALGRADEHPSVRRRIEANIDAFNGQSEKPYRLSFSIGIVSAPMSTILSFNDLLKRADEHMYAEKAAKARNGHGALRSVS